MDNLESGRRRVLLVIEDETLAELLDETLRDAGHETLRARDGDDLEALLGARPFDSVVVDLDTRARTGLSLLARLRRSAPSSTIVALLPCGGLPAGIEDVGYHLALEKPARLGALLSAVTVRRRMQ